MHLLTTGNKLLAAAALLGCTAFVARPAHAQGHWERRRVNPVGAAVVTGVVVGAVIGGLLAPPPPPVQVYAPPPPPYYGPRVVVVPPPPPAVVVQAPPSAGPTVGIGVSGVMQTLDAGEGLTGGAAVDLQLRTSPHALLSLELQSLEARRSWDGLERSDVAGLVGARLYPWDFVLSPFLDLAVGFGRATVQCCRYEEHATQFLGRYGVGLELRLGSHLALDAEVAQVYRLRLDGPAPGPVADRERASDVRGGVTFLF